MPSDGLGLEVVASECFTVNLFSQHASPLISWRKLFIQTRVFLWGLANFTQKSQSLAYIFIWKTSEPSALDFCEE